MFHSLIFLLEMQEHFCKYCSFAFIFLWHLCGLHRHTPIYEHELFGSSKCYILINI